MSCGIFEASLIEYLSSHTHFTIIHSMKYRSAQDALEKTIREVPDFPKKGIVFQDITPVLQGIEATQVIIREFTSLYKNIGWH